MSLDEIRAFIVGEFLPGEDPGSLGPDVPLLSSGVVDSVGALKLVLFLEQRYGVTVDPDDIAAGKLDTLADIETLLAERRR